MRFTTTFLEYKDANFLIQHYWKHEKNNTIDVSGLCLSKLALTSFSDYLKDENIFENIKYIIAVECEVDFDATDAFVDLLRGSYDKLVKLDLNGIEFLNVQGHDNMEGQETMMLKIICSLQFWRPKRLRFLDMSTCLLGPKHFGELSIMFTVLAPSLNQLILRDNDLGSDGIVEVVRALSDCGSDVSELYLGFNGAGNLIMEELLGEHTKKLAKLKKIELIGNQLSEDNVELLQDHFRESFREDGVAVEVVYRPPDADVDSEDDFDNYSEVNAVDDLDNDLDDDAENEDDFDRNAGVMYEDVYPDEEEEEEYDTGFESTLLY